LTTTFSRKLSGQFLDEISKELENMIPSKVRNKLHAKDNLDKEALSRGNLTCVGKLKALQQLRVKVKLNIKVTLNYEANYFLYVFVTGACKKRSGQEYPT
jgi:hypothetical protein